jgi:hypothetical protein
VQRARNRLVSHHHAIDGAPAADEDATGRTIKIATTEPGGALVLFDDQSSMKIKTAGPATVSPDKRDRTQSHDDPASVSEEFEKPGDWKIPRNVHDEFSFKQTFPL